MTDERAALHVGDPRYDDWDVVHDFEDLHTARAWRGHPFAHVPAVHTSFSSRRVLVCKRRAERAPSRRA